MSGFTDEEMACVTAFEFGVMHQQPCITAYGFSTVEAYRQRSASVSSHSSALPNHPNGLVALAPFANAEVRLTSRSLSVYRQADRAFYCDLVWSNVHDIRQEQLNGGMVKLDFIHAHGSLQLEITAAAVASAILRAVAVTAMQVGAPPKRDPSPRGTSVSRREAEEYGSQRSTRHLDLVSKYRTDNTNHQQQPSPRREEAPPLMPSSRDALNSEDTALQRIRQREEAMRQDIQYTPRSLSAARRSTSAVRTSSPSVQRPSASVDSEAARRRRAAAQRGRGSRSSSVATEFTKRDEPERAPSSQRHVETIPTTNEVLSSVRQQMREDSIIRAASENADVRSSVPPSTSTSTSATMAALYREKMTNEMEELMKKLESESRQAELSVAEQRARLGIHNKPPLSPLPAQAPPSVSTPQQHPKLNDVLSPEDSPARPMKFEDTGSQEGFQRAPPQAPPQQFVPQQLPAAEATPLPVSQAHVAPTPQMTAPLPTNSELAPHPQTTTVPAVVPAPAPAPVPVAVSAPIPAPTPAPTEKPASPTATPSSVSSPTSPRQTKPAKLRVIGEWKEVWDEGKGKLYYYNTVTRKTTWKKAGTPFEEALEEKRPPPIEKVNSVEPVKIATAGSPVKRAETDVFHQPAAAAPPVSKAPPPAEAPVSKAPPPPAPPVSKAPPPAEAPVSKAPPPAAPPVSKAPPPAAPPVSKAPAPPEAHVSKVPPPAAPPVSKAPPPAAPPVSKAPPPAAPPVSKAPPPPEPVNKGLESPTAASPPASPTQKNPNLIREWGVWLEMKDPKKDKIYYRHKETREAVWKAPPDVVKMQQDAGLLGESSAASSGSASPARPDKPTVVKEWGNWIEMHDPKKNKNFFRHKETKEAAWKAPPEVLAMQEGTHSKSQTNSGDNEKKNPNLVKEWGSWVEMHDPKKNRNYFRHKETKEAVWKAPAEVLAMQGSGSASPARPDKPTVVKEWGKWVEMHDPKKNKNFFRHKETKEAAWKAPPEVLAMMGVEA